MILIDTGALYALYARGDQNHKRAVAWLRNNSERLVTTDFIISETLTLFRARRHLAQAKALSRRLAAEKFVGIVWVTQSDFQAAWNMFDQFSDKSWSFTDCTSRVVMDRLGIAQAFAFDDHFRQFGTITVVP